MLFEQSEECFSQKTRAHTVVCLVDLALQITLVFQGQRISVENFVIPRLL